MRARIPMVALASLVVVQLVGMHVFVSANVSAQTDQEVMVLIGEKNLDACQAQYFE